VMMRISQIGETLSKFDRMRKISIQNSKFNIQHPCRRRSF